MCNCDIFKGFPCKILQTKQKIKKKSTFNDRAMMLEPECTES